MKWKVILTICITVSLLFMSGADYNPISVTLIGVFAPMLGAYVAGRHLETESEGNRND